MPLINGREAAKAAVAAFSAQFGGDQPTDPLPFLPSIPFPVREHIAAVSKKSQISLGNAEKGPFEFDLIRGPSVLRSASRLGNQNVKHFMCRGLKGGGMKQLPFGIRIMPSGLDTLVENT